MDIYFKQLQSLGLSESQIKALDKMDGKADNKISQSIFTSAQTLLNGSSPDKAIAQNKGDENLIRSIANIIFGGKTSETSETSDTKANGKESPEQKAENETRTKMQPMLDKAAAYYEKMGSLKGFSFKNFPKEICHVEFSGDAGYEDTSNDVFKIGSDGKGDVNRKADSYKLILKVEYWTGDGKSNTIFIEKQLSKVPPKLEIDANGKWDTFKEF